MKNKKFAKLIKQKREVLGLTQQKVADNLYISRSSYGLYETGERDPSIETLLNIAVLYDADLMELLHSLSNYKNWPYNAQYQKINPQEYAALSDSEQKLLYDYNYLNQEQKEMVNSLINSFFK